MTKGIILAAGRGSRMGKLTDYQPKCLTKINGKTLIEGQIENFKKCGIYDIAVVTGYKREVICTFGSQEFYNRNWSETQMVSSLECASAWLENFRCVVTYSDIFFSSSAIKSLLESKNNIAITYDPNWLDIWSRRFGDPLEDAEFFRLSPEGEIMGIGLKANTTEEINGQFMGLLAFSPIGWDIANKVRGQNDSSTNRQQDMTSLLQQIILADITQIKALPYNGDWGEVDTADDLLIYGQ